MRRLLIVSHVTHYRDRGRLLAYAPYAREIDIWADLFSEVVIAAPCRLTDPPSDCMPMTRSNITMAPQREKGGDTWQAKLAQIVALPRLTWDLARVMFKADAIHVRCPGNLGFLGGVLAPLFSRRLVAKYAGQWSDYPGEPFTWKMQRTLLKSRWWTGPVTVYGRGSGDPDKVVSFFTSIMTDAQVKRASAAAAKRRFTSPFRILFVGRLTRSKNVDVLLAAIAKVRDQGVALSCSIVGDGPQRLLLETLCSQLDLEEQVEFAGGVEFDRVLDYYEKSDVLVLASQTEGWPKCIAEAMAFGLVCIGSERGLMPDILSEGRGLVVPPRDVDALAGALWRLAAAPHDYRSVTERAAAWGQQYSLEGLRAALRETLAVRWGVTLREPANSSLPESIESP